MLRTIEVVLFKGSFNLILLTTLLITTRGESLFPQNANWQTPGFPSFPSDDDEDDEDAEEVGGDLISFKLWS